MVRVILSLLVVLSMRTVYIYGFSSLCVIY